MSESQERSGRDAGIPEMTERGRNPGWRIRIGSSREEIRALAAADERGVWFDSEEELNSYVRRQVEADAKEENTE